MKRSLIGIVIIMLLMSGCNQARKVEEELGDGSSSLELEHGNQDESQSEESKAEESVEDIVEPEERQYIIRESFVVENIRDRNVLGDDGERTHIVILPDDYYDTEENYPIVYYFHGFGSEAAEVYGLISDIQTATEEALIPAAIYVSVSNNTSLSGSFMENSEMTGYWEDGFIEEIIPHMDEQYRTIAAKEGRYLLGHSMGGHSVIKIGLNHPDVVNGFFAYSPGCLKDDEFDVAMESWKSSSVFLRAYGAAFGNDVVEDIDTLIPIQDGSDADNKLIDTWLDGYGHLEDRVSNYLAKDERLAVIGLEVGERDNYSWIVSGTEHLHKLLDEAGIEHRYDLTNRGHSMDSSTVVEIALPLFFENISNE